MASVMMRQYGWRTGKMHTGAGLMNDDARDKIDKAIADRTYVGQEGAGIGYLIAGRRPG